MLDCSFISKACMHDSLFQRFPAVSQLQFFFHPVRTIAQLVGIAESSVSISSWVS